MVTDRILSLADEDERTWQELRIRAFEIFLVLHVTARAWFWAFPVRGDTPHLRIAMAGAFTVCLAFVLRRSSARMAVTIAAGIMGLKVWLSFPGTSNHAGLEFLFLTLLAFIDRREEGERTLFLNVSRWAVAIVLFYTGLQKVMYGTYFKAQYLGYSISTGGKFTRLFRHLLPEEELQRLLALPVRTGAGSFAVDSPLLVAMSNSVWVFEMVAPVFLIWRRTRTVAALVAIGFTWCLQAGAREFMFGAVYTNLLLLFLPKPWNARVLPVFALMYPYLFLVYFDVVPSFYFN